MSKVYIFIGAAVGLASMAVTSDWALSALMGMLWPLGVLLILATVQ